MEFYTNEMNEARKGAAGHRSKLLSMKKAVEQIRERIASMQETTQRHKQSLLLDHEK